MFVMNHSTKCLILYLKVDKHFDYTKNYKDVWMLTKPWRCNEEAVVEVDIHVGDDDNAKVEKSPKNEKSLKNWQATKSSHQEKLESEATERSREESEG